MRGLGMVIERHTAPPSADALLKSGVIELAEIEQHRSGLSAVRVDPEFPAQNHARRIDEFSICLTGERAFTPRPEGRGRLNIFKRLQRRLLAASFSPTDLKN